MVGGCKLNCYLLCNYLNTCRLDGGARRKSSFSLSNLFAFYTVQELGWSFVIVVDKFL